MKHTIGTERIGEDTTTTARRNRLSHAKQIGLRLPSEELNETLTLAAAESRSVSNFALLVHRLGVAEFKRRQSVAQ